MKVGLVALFAIAGFDTVAITVSWAVYELCRNPRVAERMKREIDELYAGDEEGIIHAQHLPRLPYVTMVWKEVLRLHPPGAVFLRVAEKDAVLPGSGTAVKKGAHVFAALFLAQVSKKHWKEPEKFKPERFEPENGEAKDVPKGAYLPFSAGIANCAGEFLANLEGPLLIAAIYRQFEFDLACSPDQVVSSTEWLQQPKASCPAAGVTECTWGMPVRVRRRAV